MDFQIACYAAVIASTAPTGLTVGVTSLFITALFSFVGKNRRLLARGIKTQYATLMTKGLMKFFMELEKLKLWTAYNSGSIPNTWCQTATFMPYMVHTLFLTEAEAYESHFRHLYYSSGIMTGCYGPDAPPACHMLAPRLLNNMCIRVPSETALFIAGCYFLCISPHTFFTSRVFTIATLRRLAFTFCSLPFVQSDTGLLDIATLAYKEVELISKAKSCPVALHRSMDKLRSTLNPTTNSRLVISWLDIFRLCIMMIITYYATSPSTTREEWIELGVLLSDIVHYITMEIPATLSHDLSPEQKQRRSELMQGNEMIRMKIQGGSTPMEAAIACLASIAGLASALSGDKTTYCCECDLITEYHGDILEGFLDLPISHNYLHHRRPRQPVVALLPLCDGCHSGGTGA